MADTSRFCVTMRQETVKVEKEKVADGTTFKKMPFEGMGNTMDGGFPAFPHSGCSLGP